MVGTPRCRQLRRSAAHFATHAFGSAGARGVGRRLHDLLPAMLDKRFACRFTRPAQRPLKTFKCAFEFGDFVVWPGPASAYARRIQFVTPTAAPDGASSNRRGGVGRRGESPLRPLARGGHLETLPDVHCELQRRRYVKPRIAERS